MLFGDDESKSLGFSHYQDNEIEAPFKLDSYISHSNKKVSSFCSEDFIDK